VPHEVRKEGSKYVVVETVTETVAFGPTTKTKAEEFCQQQQETGAPDKVGYLPDGKTKVNIHYKNKDKYNGEAK
jgi:S-adenosylmethionine synthetase